MAENPVNTADRRCAVTDFAVGQLVRVASGILADTTGAIEPIGESRDRGLKVDGWPAGVYVIVVNEAIKLEPI
jgi:transcription antitermination factor NusG